MPRKLLRVALVAAIIPALAPETSSAQTVKAGSTVRTTASTQPTKKGVAGWLQRMRGESPATGKIIKVSDENPFDEPESKKDTPFDLEGNADVQLLKSNQSNRRRPTSKVMEFGSNAPQQAAAVSNQSATITPGRTAARTAPRTAPQTATTDIDNPFPDDAPTGRRSRLVATPATAADFSDENNLTATSPQDVATPVDANDVESDALPIESATPPADVNAVYRSREGAVPEYRRTNLQDTEVADDVPTPAAPPTPSTDVRFANPGANAPAGRVATRSNGGPAVINGPQSSLPPYGAPPPGSPYATGAVGGPVYGGPVYGGPAGYAQLDSALYPSPRQDIPPYVGSTMITNQAFDPHEMLYAHRYRGLYGPFYHKTTRSWILTPFGVCKNEKRVLVGTEVKVNYKSSISPFSLFFPPVIK